MFVNSLILAISSSIDSLGIGITYGIKKTKIPHISKLILFGISFLISLISLCFGNIIKTLINENFTKILGCIFFILIGFFICYQALRKDSNENKKFEIINLDNPSKKIYSFFIKFLRFTKKTIKNPINSDLDNSKTIDSKEALFLGFALSLDSFCIGIGGGIVGISIKIFPFLISIFQLFFLSFGNIIGIKLNNLFNLPNNIWSVISGIVLIIIGLLKFFK